MDEPDRRAVRIVELVRVVETRARLRDHAGGDPELGKAIGVARLRDQLAGRDSVEVRHHEEVLGAVAPELVDLADVRVVEACDQLAFVEEHRDERARRAQLREQALDHDDLLEPGLTGEPREVDLRHPAGREQADQLVAAEMGRRGLVGVLV